MKSFTMKVHVTAYKMCSRASYVRNRTANLNALYCIYCQYILKNNKVIIENKILLSYYTLTVYKHSL